MVKVLLDAMADQHGYDASGCNVIYIAAQMGHVDVVKYLLEARADAEALNLHGCLQVATENGFVEVVELLESEASLVRNDGKLGPVSTKSSNHGEFEEFAAFRSNIFRCRNVS